MTNRIVRRNLLHRPLRTLLTVSAVAVEVAMILMIWGTADGMMEQSLERRRAIGADILVRPGSTSGQVTSGTAGLETDVLRQLESVPEVDHVLATVFLMMGNLQTVTGVDLDEYEAMSGKIRYLDGGPFEGPSDAIIDHVFAAQRKLKPGDTIELFNREFRISGLMETGRLTRIFVPLESLQEIMGWEDKFSQAYLLLHDPAKVDAVVEHLRQKMPGKSVHSMEEYLSLFRAEIHAMADVFIRAVVGIALTVGFLVVLLSMYTAVLDRTREIGILKALGAAPGYVLNIFVRETFWLTMLGATMGLALGYGSAGLVESYFPLVRITLLPEHVATSLVIALAASILGALYPALKAARQDPIDALAYE